MWKLLRVTGFRSNQRLYERYLQSSLPKWFPEGGDGDSCFVAVPRTYACELDWDAADKQDVTDRLTNPAELVRPGARLTTSYTEGHQLMFTIEL